MPVLEDLADQVAAVFRGHKWLVALDHAMPASDLARSLLDLGAESVYAVGASRGHGEPAEGVPTLFQDVHGTSMMHAIRACEAALHALPDDIVAVLDAWDPAREARVVRALFADDTPVAHRACFGARPRTWVALEDKTVIDAVWDELGVPRSPSVVVPCTREALDHAHRTLDTGNGTVWAGDSRSGWHGGGEFTRWVRDEATADAALATLLPACDTVRVMPFLRGLPCSIHGIVLPEAVIALRPCEMVVFNDADTGSFTYGQVATHWDPPDEDRRAMRALARRVGEGLRERVGFRGAFTVDGVLTEDGFRPTELNPRFGAGLNVLARSVPELPLYLWNVALVAGRAFEADPAELGRALLERMDGTRHAGCAISSPTPVDGQHRLGLALERGKWRLIAAEQARVTASVGPTASGSRIQLTLDATALPAGVAVAPLAIDAVRTVADHLVLTLPQLTAAEDVRSGP